MFRNFISLFIITSFFIIIPNFIGIPNEELGEYSSKKHMSNTPISADVRTPVSIDGNSELEQFILDNPSLNGNGLIGSPYIIENFSIDASSANGIVIQNTNAYLIIQNCTIFDGGNAYFGITLNNATNVNITNNNVVNNSFGLFLYDSHDNIVSYNNITGNANSGIMLQISNDNNISRNKAIGNKIFSVDITSSNNNIFKYNNMYGEGINLNNQSINNLIDESNKVNDKSLRYFNNMPDVNLEGEFDVGQVIFLNCDNSRISNVVISNTSIGILIIQSDNCSVINNTLRDNKYGIYLFEASNCFIYYNNIFDHTIIHAYEDYNCLDNEWDDGVVGNYWGRIYTDNNYGVSHDGSVWGTPFEISGGNNGIDNYPLVKLYNFHPMGFTQIPDDHIIENGYSNSSLSWIPAGFYPTSYVIEVDGSEIVAGAPWTDGIEIIFEIPEGFESGTYNISIILENKYGDTVRDTVMFTINSKGIGVSNVWAAGMSLLTIFGLIFSIIKKRYNMQ